MTTVAEVRTAKRAWRRTLGTLEARAAQVAAQRELVRRCEERVEAWGEAGKPLAETYLRAAQGKLARLEREHAALDARVRRMSQLLRWEPQP